MKLPKRNFNNKDLFNPVLYSKHWADTLYITSSFVNMYMFTNSVHYAEFSKTFLYYKNVKK